ncbi:MAG: hypothetical protein KC585_00230 [Candidatus Magasanikbacteria bacterium]|nr:hypothetical protein [Candidatus Magasanikbacteria bacterium]USN52776.1 MAG: hypothetical protein H6759_01760 [Candidatus Nomurabacteria bacterium]
MLTHKRMIGLNKWIDRIDPVNQKALCTLYQKEAERIIRSPGSTYNHQVWPGGYLDHMIGMLEYADRQYFGCGLDLPFELGDAVLVILLHDIEKPFKYVDRPKGTQCEFNSPFEIKKFVLTLLLEYRFKLTEMHLNALQYAHGEGDDYRPDKRVMNELAAFLHACDIWSARIEYNRRILSELRDED